MISTGLGDAFRSGFLAGIAWNLSNERSAQLGSMIATYVIETKGTQEYRFTRQSFIERFSEAYGESAAAEIAHPLSSLADYDSAFFASESDRPRVISKVFVSICFT